MINADLQKLLDTPIDVLDQLSIFSDVMQFMEFSEQNMEWMKRVELQRVEREMKHVSTKELENWHSLLTHKRDSVLFRFDVALPMRVRYASLTSLIATIEWSIAILARKATFNLTKTPKGKNEAAHLISIFANRCGLNLRQQLAEFEFLTWVRNSISHNSGVLEGYKFEQSIRAHISQYEPDFVISNWHFIGDTVEIKREAIERRIISWREIIRDLYRLSAEKRLINFKD
jgi:hypothetical protein